MLLSVSLEQFVPRQNNSHLMCEETGLPETCTQCHTVSKVVALHQPFPFEPSVSRFYHKTFLINQPVGSELQMAENR